MPFVGCAKWEKEHKDRARDFSGTARATGSPGKKAPSPGVAGPAGRMVCAGRGAALLEEESPSGCRPAWVRRAPGAQADINWQGGTPPQSLESPPARLSKTVPRRKLRAAGKGRGSENTM